MAGKKHLEVLVVGAGPVGLFAALSLAKRDVHVRIVDRRSRTNLHSYALALHPQSLRLLDGFGLANKLTSAGHWVDKVQFHAGVDIGPSLDFSQLSGSFPYALVLSQSSLEAALEEELHRCGVRVEWDHEVTALDEKDDLMRSTLQRYELQPQGYPVVEMHRLEAGHRKIDSRYVIGADGYHSFVRRALGVDYEKVGGSTMLAVFEFESDPRSGHETHVVLDRGGPCVMWPLPGGLRRWSFGIREASEYQGDPDTCLAEMVKKRAPWFEGRLGPVQWSTVVRFERRMAAKMGDAEVWLAGDAAHCGNPVGVHSLNMGLVEAHELAWRMYEILRGQSTHRLLTDYAALQSEAWRALLGGSGNVVARAGSTEWVKANADEIIASVPCSGADMKEALAQLHLDMPA